MRCTPTIHDLIVLTLPPRHRCPLDRMPASRLLLPRSGLERSDFVHLALFGRDRRVGECLLLREERKSGLRGPISVFDPLRTS